VEETCPLQRQVACVICKDHVHLPHDAVEMSDLWMADPGVSGQRVSACFVATDG
jgi:hypothetical protein